MREPFTLGWALNWLASSVSILFLFIWSSLVLAADPVPGEQYCDRTIASITFAGNRKTRNAVLLRQVALDPGDKCSLDEVIDGMQNIMDLGLFRSTSTSLSLVNDLLVLNYVVDEKISFVPIPRLSRTSDGELRLGVQLRWDNFMGLHHQMRITSERREEDDGNGRTGQHHSIDYSVPRVLDSDLGFSLGLVHSRKQSQLKLDNLVYGESERSDSIAQVQFSRWMNKRGVTRGLRYHFGLSIQRRSHEMLEGELGPFEGGRDIFANLGFAERDVRDDLFRLRGRAYGFNYSLSSSVLGSQYSYNRSDFFYKRYKPLPGLELRNLNYQVRLGYSTGGPFGERQYALGGGDSLRGMASRFKTGDVLALVNAEYLQAFSRYQSLRWVLFADIGNVYRKDRIKLHQQKFGFGAGLRWKLLSFSNTDLRFDAAWDRNSEDVRVYVTTNLTF